MPLTRRLRYTVNLAFTLFILTDCGGKAKFLWGGDSSFPHNDHPGYAPDKKIRYDLNSNGINFHRACRVERISPIYKIYSQLNRSLDVISTILKFVKLDTTKHFN